MKRTISKGSVASLIVLTIALAGCSTSNKSADSSSSPSTNPSGNPSNSPSSSYTLPLADGSKTLSIGSPDNKYAPKSYKDNLPVWQQVEKRTGVKIDWQVSDSKQYTTAMPIQMASGGKLPDIFSVVGDVKAAAANGLIIPMDDLIEKYAPNIKKILDSQPDTLKRMKSPDGKIYVLPSNLAESNRYDPSGLIINKTWLDKLGLQEPKTTEELYNVLKAFKERDPNGNGKADEVPFAPGTGSVAFNVLGDSFGLHLGGGNGFWPDANGKLTWEYISDNEKQMITYVNKLYKEGLVDPEFATKGAGDTNLAGQGILGMSSGQLNHVAGFEAAAQKGGFNDKYVMIAPPTGPSGQKAYYELASPISGTFAISKDAKDPILAIRWLDFVYGTDEGARLMNMGVEGISYTMVNGEPKFTDYALKNPDGLDVTTAIRALGGRPSLPHNVAGKYFKETLNYPGLLAQAQKIDPYLVPQIGFADTTTEENEAIFKYQPDLNTYANAQIAKYMTGAESLDSWDKYVAKVKEMNVDKLLAARQGQYDRYKK
jgi:putative aldouronate transport system substrate-binding protein